MFVATCNNATRTSQVLRNLGFHSICLHGQLSQPKRLGALNKFRAGSQNILVATDVAARGLDIPAVDMVINFDVPMTAKDYVHRVGRTARAGKAGRAITFVTQYDVEAYQHLEAQIGTKLDVVSDWSTKLSRTAVTHLSVCDTVRHRRGARPPVPGARERGAADGDSGSA